MGMGSGGIILSWMLRGSRMGIRASITKSEDLPLGLAGFWTYLVHYHYGTSCACGYPDYVLQAQCSSNREDCLSCRSQHRPLPKQF